MEISCKPVGNMRTDDGVATGKVDRVLAKEIQLAFSADI